MDWEQIATPTTTSQQRRTLYRLGLSRSFVHKHVRTTEQASELITTLLQQHAALRPKPKTVDPEIAELLLG